MIQRGLYEPSLLSIIYVRLALFLVEYIAEQTITGCFYFDEVQFSRRGITPAYETL
jgi:hypothetical protein